MKLKLLSIFLMVASVCNVFADSYSLNQSGANSSTAIWSNGTNLTWTPSLVIPNVYAPSGSAISYTSTGNNTVLRYDVSDINYRIGSFYHKSTTSGVRIEIGTGLTMTVSGDFTRSQNSTSAGRNFSVRSQTNGDGSLVIEGNLINEGVVQADNFLAFGSSSTSYTDAYALTKLTIGTTGVGNGNVTTTSANTYFNVKNGTVIKGVFSLGARTSGNSANMSGNIIANISSNASPSTKSLRVGALEAALMSVSTGSLYASGSVNQIAHVTLTGVEANTYTFHGNVANSATAGIGSLHIIMNAGDKDFTQVFAGTNTYTGDTILTQ